MNVSAHDIVWAGRGPLTIWPEVDWAVVLRDQGFEPIWDRPPLTSGWLWARMIGRRSHNPHDDQRSFLNTTPTLMEKERQDRIRQQWAKIGALLKPLTERSEVVSAEPEKPTLLKPQPVTLDAALREIARVETAQSALGRSQDVSLCSTTNKVKHRSKLWALHHRNMLAMLPDELHPEQLEAYKCRWCGSWHVGHRAEKTSAGPSSST